MQSYSKWITSTHEGLLERLIQHEVKSSAVSAVRPNPASAFQLPYSTNNHGLTDLEHTSIKDSRFHAQ